MTLVVRAFGNVATEDCWNPLDAQIDAGYVVIVTSLSDQLRRAIRDSREPYRQLAAACEVDAGNLCAFLAGRRGMSLDAVDRIAAYLQLRLVPARSKRRPKGG